MTSDWAPAQREGGMEIGSQRMHEILAGSLGWEKGRRKEGKEKFCLKKQNMERPESQETFLKKKKTKQTNKKNCF